MHTNSSQIFAAILLVATSALSAIEGRVTYLSGNADIKSSGKVTVLKLGALLKEGDTVVTRAKAKVGIQMSDGASFFVSQNASLEIRPGSPRILNLCLHPRGAGIGRTNASTHR
jgi:hypothetical protein